MWVITFPRHLSRHHKHGKVIYSCFIVPLKFALIPYTYICMDVHTYTYRWFSGFHPEAHIPAAAALVLHRRRVPGPARPTLPWATHLYRIQECTRTSSVVSCLYIPRRTKRLAQTESQWCIQLNAVHLGQCPKICKWVMLFPFLGQKRRRTPENSRYQSF